MFDLEGTRLVWPPVFGSYGKGPTIKGMAGIDDRDHVCGFLTVLAARGIKVVPRSTVFAES
jgi:hypothetical protein